ncbi:MAG: GNAT family N-acetyltransferase [Desulfobacula sp.]|uniref:GNAT family N-acetyltransferase n=1 Tax=Desulfobacula sp. TaxID=2593537 RepID=UPI0025C06308|nr:GNAT family N-acetyltransferase [Desulfobacula sp.]MCD4719918.1 GNAT family N-acetyltransferase [Desulfobacula sp.]
MNQFEELNRSHNRAGFDCGVEELNIFLKNLARQNLKKGLSRTFVLTEKRIPKEILGFYTLSIFEINALKLPEKFVRKYKGNIPAVKIARLAVAKGVQNQGIGRNMMIDAVNRTIKISENAGIIGLFVDAKNRGVKEYYQKFGFIPLSDKDLNLFLPLKTLLHLYSSVFGNQ